jgi:hypothetical protein
VDDPIRDVQVALPVAAVHQATDPIAYARFVDQAEQRQEDDREEQRDRPEGGQADIGDAA